MPTLQNIHGGSLVADIDQPLALFNTRKERARANRLGDLKLEGIEQALGSLEGGQAPITRRDENAIKRLRIIAPDVAASIDKGNAADRQAARAEAENGLRQAKVVNSQKDFAGKQRALLSLARDTVAAGGNPTRIFALLRKTEPELALALKKMEIAGKDIGTLTKTTETFEDVKNDAGQVTGQINTVTNRRVGVPGATGDGGMASAVTKIMADGSTIQALPSGDVSVKNPAGEVVKGPERLAVLKAAQQSELEQAGAKAGTKAAAASAIKQSDKAIENLGKIKTSIQNMDDAIAAIDQGAKTGAIMSRLPSIRSASIKLDNIQKAMGLDVIGTTTFGALSKGELDLALSKAIPTGLEPEALREWLVEKKTAQEKLAGYLENAAIFLGMPGNTPRDWVLAQKNLRAEADAFQSDGKTTDQATPPGGYKEGDVVTNPQTKARMQLRGNTWHLLP